MFRNLSGQFIERFWTDFLIDVSPPYGVLGQIIRNDEAVFWGASVNLPVFTAMAP